MMDIRERAKRGFEAELIRPLGVAIFEYTQAWARFGGNVPMTEKIAYAQNLNRVLERHYARVMLGFQGLPLDDADPSLQRSAPSPILAERYFARAHKQAQMIIRSLDRDLSAALIEANSIGPV